jgi:hypothetical protein
MATYGNQTGLNLLDTFSDCKEMMKRLETFEARTTTLKAEINSLKIQVKDLTLSEGYRSIRNRFIKVYRRDVLKNITKEGYKMIGNGNGTAHHGDVIADSAFYSSFQRYDEDTFVHIYGLSTTQSKLFGKSYPLFLVISLHYILFIDHLDNSSAILTINAGATWRARGADNPEEVAAAYEAFITELKANPTDSLTDGTTVLSKAYYGF